MLVWIVVGILLALAGFAALALLGLRLWRQVRQFANEVTAAGERLATASAELQRVTPRSP